MAHETTAVEGSIFDAHCHGWQRWPYLPPVPDELTRGSIDQLVYEMEANGVSEALLICASIENNLDNIEYVTSASERHPGRFHVLADLDCSWATTYHTPGSADRLRALDDRYRLAGFTHYLAVGNDGWLRSDEADAVFSAAGERRMMASVAAGPAWQADLRQIARRHPDVPILCHHLGDVRAGDSAGLDELLLSATVPNIYVKASGFHYASQRGWDHPWHDALELLRRLLEVYGPGRLCWGSDFPASKRFCTYRQSLEAVRTHCYFFTPEDLTWLLGGTLRAILLERGANS